MKENIVIFLGLMSILGSCDIFVQQWNESASDAISPGTGLLDTWPDEGPELLWKYEGLGKGYGGPVISKEGIFINAEENSNSYTVGLDHNGTFRWRSPNGKEFVGTDYSASYPGTRSVPSVKGRRVYAVSGTGHMSCFDTRTGKAIWTVDIIKDFNGNLGEFGYSESPTIDETRVYCFPAGSVNNIVALDRLTGELVWSAPVNKDNFSYGTPILLNLPNRNILVGTSRNYIHVVDRQDGKLLSSYQLEDIKEGNEHCNSVVYQDRYIFFVHFKKNGQGTIKLLLSSDGRTLSEVWRNWIVTNVFEGFVVVDNRLYTTLENKNLVGLDVNTGRIRSSVRAVSGSIVYADSKLFVYGHNGKVQFFSLDGGEPELKSEMRISGGSGQHFSFPVIADGVMYIRRGDALMAYAVK